MPSAPPGVDPYASVDRVARMQTIAAIVLGLVLIAIPLYLWRRPRADAPPVTSAITLNDAGALFGEPPDASAASSSAPQAPTVALSEAKVIEVPRHRVATDGAAGLQSPRAARKSLAAAITGAASCVPSSLGGGTLVYVVDATSSGSAGPSSSSFPRTAARSARRPAPSARSTPSRQRRSPPRRASASSKCRTGLAGATLEGIPHQHGRYKIAITATYAASN